MEPETNADPNDVEAEARSEGWVPETEWRGDPPKHGFLTAEEYVTRGKTVIPILNSKLKKRDEEMEALRAELNGIKQTAGRFEQFSQQAIAREQAERKRLEEALEARRAQAITDGDGQAAVAAERQLHEVRQAPAPPPPPQMDPALAEKWVADNPWFGSDPTMQRWARALSKELLDTGRAQPGIDVLNRVAEEAKRAFPDRFEEAPRSRLAGVESNGRRQAPVLRRTFDDLPQEAKAEFTRFTTQLGVRMTKQQYLDQYDWSDA
jgi:hypothetical protein